MTLQDQLGVALPIIQAPMAGSQDSRLLLAVAETGALGSLPSALFSLAALEAELRAIKQQTTRPINLNFFCHREPEIDPAREAAWRALLAPYYAELGVDPDAIQGGPGRLPFSAETLEVIAPFRPAVVSFHFGLPAPELVDKLKAWGAQLLSTATTVAEARWLEARGVDAIIAQGSEAGGHRGMFLSDDVTTQMGTFALLPQIVSAVRVPVIAAGGIADARGVAAARALGAAAVQVGTAFLLCPEATTSPVHRAALASPQAEHTALTNLFSGRPARGIVNRLMRERGPLNPALPAFPLAGAALAPLRAKAEGLASGDFSPLWSGQNASACRERPAREVVQALSAGL
jgi:nitronate monooxygenase